MPSLTSSAKKARAKFFDTQPGSVSSIARSGHAKDCQGHGNAMVVVGGASGASAARQVGWPVRRRALRQEHPSSVRASAITFSLSDSCNRMCSTPLITIGASANGARAATVRAASEKGMHVDIETTTKPGGSGDGNTSTICFNTTAQALKQTEESDVWAASCSSADS